jgi:hypothetical protein
MVSKDEEAALKVAAAGLKVFEKNDKRVPPIPPLCELDAQI